MLCVFCHHHYPCCQRHDAILVPDYSEDDYDDSITIPMEGEDFVPLQWVPEEPEPEPEKEDAGELEPEEDTTIFDKQSENGEAHNKRTASLKPTQGTASVDISSLAPP